MRKIWIMAILAAVALAAGVACRGKIRNTVFATLNRGKVTLDHTGNRTNDIPSRRGELPVDLQ